MPQKINDHDLDYVTETLLKAIVEDKVVVILQDCYESTKL